MQWYYAIDGQQYGPVEFGEVAAMARSGKLKPADLVWNQTMGSQWGQAETVPELFPARSAAEEATPPALWSDAASFASRTLNRDLMAEARSALSGKWGTAVGAMLVYTLISVALAFIPVLGAIISFVISGPLMLGFTGFFLSLGRGQGVTVGMIFQGFSRFGTAFLAALLTAIFVLLWAMTGIALCVIAAVIGAASAMGGTHHSGMPFAALLVLGIPLAVIPATIAQYRYMMTYFVLVDSPDVGALDAIRRSKRMMHGNKWKCFCLQLRFIGWGLLCVLTLGIGFLWLLPYMRTSLARFYDDLRAGRQG